jgi:hypothetical protein
MIEVREITCNSLICPSSVINSSVMPSEKYSWDASTERLSSGSTTGERISGNARAIGRNIQNAVAATTSTAKATISHALATVAVGRWQSHWKKQRFPGSQGGLTPLLRRRGTEQRNGSRSQKRLHEARVLRRVAEGAAEPFQGRAEAVFEIDKRVCRPELPAEFFPRNQLARVFQQADQDLYGLTLKPDLVALFP